MSEQKTFAIPKTFHSDANARPFTNCKVCTVDLTSSAIPYTVEKAYRKQPDGSKLTLFEIAICLPCAKKQAEQMSPESQTFLQQTLMTEEVLQKRQKLWESEWQDKWDENCLFSNTRVNALEEYHVVGHFQNGKVIPGQVPFVIGETMLEYLQEHLSQSTKDAFDDFGKRHLGPDPTIAKLLEDYQFMLV